MSSEIATATFTFKRALHENSRQVIPRYGSACHGGTVSGRVRRARGPAADVTVVLAPPSVRRRNAALFRTATVDEDGAFVIRGVAPGAYSLIPLESRPAGEPWLNADFLAKYEGRGQTLQITAGSTAQLDLH